MHYEALHELAHERSRHLAAAGEAERLARRARGRARRRRQALADALELMLRPRRQAQLRT